MSALVVAGVSILVLAGAEPRVAESAEEIHPLLIGAEAPDVTLRDVDSAEVKLRDLLSEKPTVLIFYRGGWCPYCNTQLGAIAKIDPRLRELGYQIVAVSPDKPQKLRESLDKENLTYTLLSDSKMEGAKGFGIAFEVDEPTVENYKTYGIDLDEASGESHHLLPVPSVFVLDTDASIRFKYINPDYKVRLDPDVLLAAAKAAAKNQE